MTNTITVRRWGGAVEMAVAAWLYAKKGRTGSTNTLSSYAQTIHAFRAALHQVGLDLDGETQAVALVAQAWASRDRRGGRREVAASTSNQRLAALSSFYVFAAKRGLLDCENPMAVVDRKPVQGYAGARALSAQSVAAALRGIDRNTNAGKRDYALLSVALHTGRRASELAGLRWGELCGSSRGQ
jgi:site-specific recombinase XerD